MAADCAPNSGLDLAMVVHAIAAGDAVAEKRLVEHFQRVVRALVRRHCRIGETQTEDICQDVLWRLIQRLRSGAIEQPSAVPGYLHTMIRHACAAHYRDPSPSAPLDSVAEPVDPDPGPDRHIEALQVAARVRALMETLPVARDRELLRQFYLQDKTQAEVCAALQIEEEHFRRVAHRARSRLRELVEHSEGRPGYA